MRSAVILWFRNDLRVADSALLDAASKLQPTAVLAVIANVGLPVGKHRPQGSPARAFRLECVSSLVEDLQEHVGLACCVSDQPAVQVGVVFMRPLYSGMNFYSYQSTLISPTISLDSLSISYLFDGIRPRLSSRPQRLRHHSLRMISPR
jgi:hypothetical protein